MEASEQSNACTGLLHKLVPPRNGARRVPGTRAPLLLPVSFAAPNATAAPGRALAQPPPPSPPLPCAAQLRPGDLLTPPRLAPSQPS